MKLIVIECSLLPFERFKTEITFVVRISGIEVDIEDD